MTNARTTVIQNVLQFPGTSNPWTNHHVTIRLNTVGFVNSGSTEKVRQRTVTTDSTGLWSVALEVNDDIDPAGTYYTVSEVAGSTPLAFIVPYSATPLNLRAVLVVDPSNPDPLVAGVPLPAGSVPAGYVWTTDGAGSGAYAAEAAGGVASVFGRSGAVTAQTGDYTKAQVGLGNVDNTADASKPVSTAQAAADTVNANAITAEAATARAAETANATAISANTTAISTETTRATTAEALLAPKASPALTGTPTAPTATPGANSTQLATTAYADAAAIAATVGLLDYRGTYNASGNTFPSSGGSGSAGAILKGDFWIVSTPGTLGGTAVANGDLVIALIDSPGSTAANWDLIEHDVGYAPENVANKSTDGTLAANSTTLYPSQSAAKSYADAKVENSVTAGHTTVAPSGDAVSVALALKASKAQAIGYALVFGGI